jgi:two-component system, OmpR family, aerobic respiration control sensor histidine kinase ArcB
VITKDIIEFIFASALFINASLFVPQAIKIFKEKNSIGISLITFLGFLIIQFVIVLHGIFNHDLLLTFGYLLSMITCSAVVILALIYKKQHHGFLQSRKINFEECLEQFPGHVYWKNTEGVCLGCNSNNWKDFGLKSLNDFIGKTDYELFPKEQADKIRQADLEVINTGQPKIFEEEAVTYNGNVKLYLSHKVPLRNFQNQIIGILGISFDITDARKKEIERLDFLENIISVMPGTVYWMNRDGVYLGCNDNEAKAIGLKSRKEIIGKRNVDIPGFLVPEALDPVNKEVMESGKALLLEEPAILADGTKATFLSNKVPLYNNSGEVTGMVGISFDITEKKRIEQELLETKNKLEGMTLISAAMAHEMRTPLSAFNIATDNVKVIFPRLKQAYLWAKEHGAPVENIESFYLDFVEETLNTMQKEVQSASTFIDIALMNTNPSLDMGYPKILSISDVIDEALSRYPFAGQRALVKWQRDTTTGFQIKSDKLLITHVLFNLIKNALYYVTKAGKGDIHIWLESGSTYNKLYFKDTGTGITSDILPRIFDQFFSTTDKSAHPAGVGLTFCKRVMESLKGGITCESVEGDYTLFILEFPVNI